MSASAQMCTEACVWECVQDASLSLPIKNQPQRAERQEGRRLSAEFAQFQFVISIYDQVTTSPEKEAFHGSTDTYCCVNYRPLLALPIYALCSFLTLSSDSFLPFLKNHAQGAAVFYMPLGPATDNCFSFSNFVKLIVRLI